MDVERKAFASLTLAERAAWRDIQRSNPALGSPYFRLEYAEALARVRREAEVLVARRDGEIAGFLAIQSGGFSARPLGGDLSDLHGVVARPGSGLCFEPLARAGGLALFSFSGVPQGEGVLSREAACLETFHQIDLSAGAGAWHGAVRKKSSSLKRLNAKRNKLARAFGEIEIALDSVCEASFDQLWAWKSRQYRESGHRDLAREVWFRDLMEDFFSRRDREFRGVLSTLSCGGRPIAAHFGIMADGVLHYWFPAYDPLAHRFSPGLLLLETVALRHRELGIGRIDLGPGDFRYKLEFANAGMQIGSGLAGAGPVRSAVRRLAALERRLAAAPLGALASVPRRAVLKLDRMMAA